MANTFKVGDRVKVLEAACDSRLIGKILQVVGVNEFSVWVEGSIGTWSQGTKGLQKVSLTIREALEKSMLKVGMKINLFGVGTDNKVAVTVDDTLTDITSKKGKFIYTIKWGLADVDRFIEILSQPEEKVVESVIRDEDIRRAIKILTKPKQSFMSKTVEFVKRQALKVSNPNEFELREAGIHNECGELTQEGVSLRDRFLEELVSDKLVETAKAINVEANKSK